MSSKNCYLINNSVCYAAKLITLPCFGFTSDGNYVIVNGGLKGFQGKRHVVAYSVR